MILLNARLHTPHTILLHYSMCIPFNYLCVCLPHPASVIHFICSHYRLHSHTTAAVYVMLAVSMYMHTQFVEGYCQLLTLCTVFLGAYQDGSIMPEVYFAPELSFSFLPVSPSIA